MKFDTLLEELHQAWRTLLRKPGYFVLASLTLAFGVATSSAVFSLVDQALLRSLSFPHSDQLVSIGMDLGNDATVAAPAYYRHLAGMPEVESMGIVDNYSSNANITYGDSALVVSVRKADGGFLDALAIPLALGRNFTAEETRPNGPSAVILRHEFWRNHFGGDPAVLNQSIQMEGKPAVVVGILPPNFSWMPFDMLLPMQLAPNATETATNEIIVARLKDAQSPEGTSPRINTSLHALFESLKSGMADWEVDHINQVTFSAKPLINQFTSKSRANLWLFLAASICVLLIAAINLTNLMMLRAIARSHDSAVRAALGASRMRLAMPSMAEGIWIGLCGSLLGLALAWAGLRLFSSFVPPEWLRGGTVHLTLATWGFAVLVGVGVAVLAAVLGMWRGQGANVMQELMGGGRGGWSRGASRLGKVLVAAQAALAVVLMLGAALFARSLYELSAVPMGFESRPVLTFSLTPVKNTYTSISAVERQSRDIAARLQQIPGVESVTASTNLPTGSRLNLPITLPDDRQINVPFRPVTSQYLKTFDIPVVAGRGLEERDSAGAENVCIVSAAFAEQYLDDKALDKVIRGPGGGTMRIVGVAGNVRQDGPAEPPSPVLYLPLAQVHEDTWTLLRNYLGLRYAIRVHGEPLAFEQPLRSALREVAPDQPIADVMPMDAVVASTTSAQKLNMLLVGIFAGLALLLACVGLYAIMAVAVAARQHEFGIRAALGAQPARLLKQVLLESGIQVAIGLLVGLTAALAASKVIQRFLFGVSPVDAVAIAAVVAVLLVAGLVASLGPAVRAAQVPPMRVLRND